VQLNTIDSRLPFCYSVSRRLIFFISTGRCIMLHRLLVIAVMLGFIQSLHPYQIPASSSNSQHTLYLPLVFSPPPLVDVVELGTADWMGYPGEVCIFGYVTSNSPTAVYSVTLAVDVTVYPYCYEDYCPPYSETVFTEPVLEATVPEQLNPFSYCLMYAKTYYSFVGVRLAHASTTPQGDRIIYPLTVTDYLKEGTKWETTVTGTVRNDSGHRLNEARVVGIAGLCNAKEAVLDTRTLEPGDETYFIFHSFYCKPSSFIEPIEMLEISAQGVAAP